MIRYIDVLWSCYHVITEEFDRTICTGPVGKDGIRPANTQELSIVNKNAMVVLNVIRDMSGLRLVEFNESVNKRLRQRECEEIARSYPDVMNAIRSRLSEKKTFRFVRNA